MTITLGEKIKTLRLSRGWTQEQLGMLSGFSRSFIKSIESGASKRPGADRLAKISKALNIPVEELYQAAGYDIGEKSEKREETPEEILEKLKLAQPVSIPVYTDFKVHAGVEHEQPVEYIYRAKMKKASKNIEAFYVHGHCMEPTISNGDIVITDRDLPREAGDVVLCLVNDELIVGRLKLKDGEVWLQNNEEVCKIDDCQASAVVIEVIKRLK